MNRDFVAGAVIAAAGLVGLLALASMGGSDMAVTAAEDAMMADSMSPDTMSGDTMSPDVMAQHSGSGDQAEGDVFMCLQSTIGVIGCNWVRSPCRRMTPKTGPASFTLFMPSVPQLKPI